MPLLEAEKWSLCLWRWMVLVYLLSERAKGHRCCLSLCPTAISHLPLPKWGGWQNAWKRWNSVCLSLSHRTSVLAITSLLLGQMAQMMVGILWAVIIWYSRGLLTQLRGDGKDFRAKLQGSGMKMVIWGSEKASHLPSHPHFKVTVTLASYFSPWNLSFLLAGDKIGLIL